MDGALTADAVRLAYLLILGRPPENDEVIRFAMTYGTLRRLRDAFLNSLEFELILNRRPKLVRADAPPLAVICEADDAAVLGMLADLGAAWDASDDAAADGSAQAAELVACLERNGLHLPASAHAFELGCGAGRVTAHLVARFAAVTACDASARQLAAAAGMAAERGLRNLTLVRADDLSFGMPDAYDLFYSYHALQYCPPPLAARALRHAFATLRPGGVAAFQLASYAYGYSYAPDAPPPRAADPRNDRHVLPQAAVFALAAEACCDTVEVFDELSVAPNALWRSTMFVLRKRLP